MSSTDIIKAIESNNILEITRAGRHQDFKMLVNIPIKENMLTPIWYMKKSNKQFDEQVLNYLIQNEAILDFKNKDDQSLLMYCIERGYSKMAYALLKNDCDIELQDSCGMSALHYAVYNLDIDIIKKLLEVGIDEDIKDNNDSTALDYLLNNLHHQHIENREVKRKLCFDLLKD